MAIAPNLLPELPTSPVTASPLENSQGELTVLDPASGDPVASIPAAGPADVDRAVGAARAEIDGGPWSRCAPAERERLLRALADLIEAEAGPLAALESLDVGKPLAEARADVAEAIAVLRYYAGWPTKAPGEVEGVGPDRLVYVEHRPVGVVGAIVPWNFPLVMATYKLGPALAAGCCVVLKPAELTPLTSLRLGHLARQAGFPPGVVQVLPGAGATAGAALAAHPGLDKVAFTGSTTVGRSIALAAAGNLTRTSLELGGKSAQIVFADADLDQAAAGIASGAFYNAGQVCVAGSRLLVHRSVHDRVVAAVAERAVALRVGPGLDPTTDMGPLVSAMQLERVMSHVDRAVLDGAGVVVGARRCTGQGSFMEPTVLVGVGPHHAIFGDEVFGPVLTVTPFDDEAQAVHLAESTAYGLAAGVWTADAGRLHRVARRLRVGTVWANCYGEFHPNVSFGGTKASGIGRELGRAGLAAYLEPTSTIVAIGDAPTGTTEDSV